MIDAYELYADCHQCAGLDVMSFDEFKLSDVYFVYWRLTL